MMNYTQPQRQTTINSCDPLTARRGLTLIESLVVITGLSMLMGVAAITLHSLTRAYTSASMSLAQTIELQRWLHRWRVDVANSQTISALAENTLQFQFANQTTVKYEIVDHHLRRMVVNEAARTNSEQARLIETEALRILSSGAVELQLSWVPPHHLKTAGLPTVSRELTVRATPHGQQQEGP